MGIGVKASNASSSASSLATPSRTTTSGSTLFAFVWWSSAPFTSITDSKSNTWTQIGAEQTGSAHKSRLYYAKNITGGAGHTVTLNLGSADGCSIIMIEITVADTVSPIDQSDQRDDTTSPFTLAAGLTTTQASEVLLSFLAGTSSSNPATHAESGLGSSTIQDEVLNGSTFWTGAVATKEVTSTGTFNPSWTESGATTGHVYLVTVKTTPPGPTINTQPEWFAGPLGGTATMNYAATTSGGTLTAQVQVSTDFGNTWANVPGATSTTSYTTPALIQTDNGTRYRVVFTDSNGSVTSVAVHLYVANLSSAGEGRRL